MDADLFLIRKMKRGDEAATEAFVRKYYPDILRYCALHCPRRADAEDLTQETFVRFFANLPGYRHQGKAKNYLYTIAAHLCINATQRIQPTPVETDTLAALAVETGAEQAATDHLLLEWALAQLPAEQREVVMLHYYQGLKLREIAEILAIGLPLVKYRLRQGRIKLQELLGKEAFTDET